MSLSTSVVFLFLWTAIRKISLNAFFFVFNTFPTQEIIRQFLPTRDSILLIKFQTHAHKKKLGGGNWLFYRLFLFFLRSKIFQSWLERGKKWRLRKELRPQIRKKKTTYLWSGTWFFLFCFYIILIQRNEFVDVRCFFILMDCYP